MNLLQDSLGPEVAAGFIVFHILLQHRLDFYKESSYNMVCGRAFRLQFGGNFLDFLHRLKQVDSSWSRSLKVCCTLFNKGHQLIHAIKLAIEQLNSKTERGHNGNGRGTSNLDIRTWLNTLLVVPSSL